MTQKQRAGHRRNSDFPIFEYIEAVMPNHLIARFMELPRHVRWTIISAAASLIILIAFLRIVVGGINHYLETRGPLGVEAYYLPYQLESRPLPEFPEETSEETRFLVLPELIGDQYTLQIPPTEEELEAINEAELEAFLSVSVPAEMALATLRESLDEPLAAVIEAEAAAIETAVETEAAVEAMLDADAAVEAIEGSEASEAIAEPVPTAAPTAVPTVHPVRVQAEALDNILGQLTVLNEALADDKTMTLAQTQAQPMQQALSALDTAGLTIPEIEPFRTKIAELAAIEPSTVYPLSNCLASSKAVRNPGESFTLPCPITQTGTFVERGDYIRSRSETPFRVTVAEFDNEENATNAVTELFHYGRTIGAVSDFAISNVIEYNYFFHGGDDLYTLTWSHENWVYSITSDSLSEIDGMMKAFPY